MGALLRVIVGTFAILPILGHAQLGHSQFRSKITFDENHKPVIEYAPVSQADLLDSCPIDTMHQDLAAAVTDLVKKVNNSVSEIKASRTAECDALKNRMTSTQSQIELALKNQFLLGQTVNGTNLNQQQINYQTQQALALNQLILTASDMMQRECIAAIDDRIVIQKLIGQVLTLGGLFLGGWEGIAVAAGGQVIGNLPLFRNDTDKAVELFQKYDEIGAKGSLLCLYRQMQKTSCLLFSRSEDQIISGIDLTFKSGATLTTLQSLEALEKNEPQLLLDIKTLSSLTESAESLVDHIEKAKELDHPTNLEAFKKFYSWCRSESLEDLKLPRQYPDSIRESYQVLQATCEKMKHYDFRTLLNLKLDQEIMSYYVGLISIRSFYQEIKGDHHSHLGDIARTWESKKYFDRFKKSVDEYRDPLAGNQNRINYLALTDHLGNSLVKSSFNSIMKVNYKEFMKKRFKIVTSDIPLPFLKPVASPRIRARSLIAMIDLCKTFDPTLSCLYIDKPSGNRLFKLWKKKCVGPKSMLCKDVLDQGNLEALIEDPGYRSYFHSLCGDELPLTGTSSSGVSEN